MIEALAAAGCYSLLAVPHGVDLEEEVVQNLRVVLGRVLTQLPPLPVAVMA